MNLRPLRFLSGYCLGGKLTLVINSYHMSVYTEVTQADLVIFLRDYDVGDLTHYQGIAEGIENTNYFVTTTEGQFVLTLFEQHDAQELAYFFEVMTFFYQQGIPSAQPKKDVQGRYFKTLCGKPAALVTRLSGQVISAIATITQCQVIGDVLARMHVVSQQFSLKRSTGRGAIWREQTAMRILPKLDTARANLLCDELKAQKAAYAHLDLPSGVTHSDLFRDNALFEGNVLKGVIDFYYACDEYLLYDLAVAINDWCVNDTGLIDADRYQALLVAYCQKRPLILTEKDNLNLMLRVAALRFWLSRLQDRFFPRQSEMGRMKDPDMFLRILKQHRHHTVI